jgi:hypothetical protein
MSILWFGRRLPEWMFGADINPEDVPLPPTLRRLLQVSAVAVAAVACALVVGIVGYVQAAVA